jgi:hypothetical protein
LQGYELPALEGAPKLLQRATHVLLETAFQQAYAGEAVFNDIVKFFDHAGYRFVRPLAFSKDKMNRIYQTDSLFERI